MKTECVTMLLAGGAGTRLGELTNNLAKPAVPFGGRYRIIDFALSNCLNSRMYTVGVLTQYAPLELHQHIGVGKPWDLDRMHNGLSILAPFTEDDGAHLYSGTADAITKNINFVDSYDPEYVLILSGDHIYHMNYRELLEEHKKKGADVTISVLEVPWEDTSRFGIMNTTDNLRIYQFEEKPKQASNNLASMGIYLFNWKVLKKYLEHDKVHSDSSHDFGKDIIPAMLADHCYLSAYRFEGYWKDVGTVQSYWEAHMDLFDHDLEKLLNNKEWSIYSHDSQYPPQRIDDDAVIHQSLIDNGCQISGSLDQSVLFENVVVKERSDIRQSILFPGANIEEDVFLERVIVQENVVVPAGTNIVAKPEEEPVVLSQNNIQALTNQTG